MKVLGTTLIDYHYDYNHSGQLTQQKGEPELDAPELSKPVDMGYDADNRLIKYNSVNLDYDPNGNLLNSPLGNYTYDSRNRLTSSGDLTYTYDSENRRIAVDSPQGTTQLVQNPNALLSQLLVRKTPDGKTTYYVYGLGLLYAETDSQAYYYHYDQQGNTLLLTDQSGKVTDQYAYSPYGETLKHEGTTDNPFQYNGRYGVMTDSNGLLQMRARYYSPELKRFVNQDILLGNIAEPLSLNRYAYVNGDPINNIDPFGLAALDSTGGSWLGNVLGITVGSASLPFVGIDNALFLANWISGSLPSQITYAENSVQIQDMIASANAALMRDKFYANNFQSQFNIVYDSGNAFFDTITNPYSTAFQVGGTAGSSVVNNGNGTATFTINNTAGTYSFFYHLAPNRPSTTGMMHNVNQTFQWTELIYQDPNQWP